MNNKTVWITGAASGVGRHLVGAFAKRGYFVFACDINADALISANQDDHWSSDSVLCHIMDICDHSQWIEAQKVLASQRSSLDIMLNIAGYLNPGFPTELTDLDISRHLDINVKGLMFGCQTAAHWMLEKQTGHIINFCSLASLLPAPGIAAYSASKFAVRGYSTSLAAQLVEHNIAVSLLCPDAIATPMLDLQTQHESAALTFSSGKELSTADIEDAIFSEVLKKRPFELIICKNTSIKIMAKLFLANPDLFIKANSNPVFKNYMLKKAKKNQQRYLREMASQKNR
ncbi:hypothetical protein A9Q99_25610 [Gammaproteobacteria bacterium 45_16_T64]|nr:hypothetical protein A9Q99_25610 [Gammaproteobacteria bacterium 45_16_T64]